MDEGSERGFPVTIPNVNANAEFDFNDHSMVDDSIRQDGVSITAGSGSVINTNSGNGKAQKQGVVGHFMVMSLSVICDLLICAMIVFVHQSSNDDADRRHHEITTQIFRSSQETKNALSMAEQAVHDAQDALNESKMNKECSHESAIWILRKDILESIERCEYFKQVTSKQYKRILDEFEYYKSIGGNHDVEDKVTEFRMKVLGTMEIKMTNQEQKQ